MPGWQQYYDNHREEGVEVLAIAMDAQGADRPRPYVEAAGATFTTVVDEANVLGEMYGFKAIPNGFLIDEEGVVRYKMLSGFDIRKAETAAVLDRWTAGLEPSEGPEPTETSTHDGRAEANALFLKGLERYRDGEVDEAVTLWRQGLELDPDNYIIHKQIWAVENPDKFYAGDVDYAWQKEQTAKGL